MTILLTIAFAFSVAGLVGFYFCQTRGTHEGYEDELGFHYGAEPTHRK